MFGRPGDSIEFGPSVQEGSKLMPAGGEVSYEGAAHRSAEYQHPATHEVAETRRRNYEVPVRATGMLRPNPAARRVTLPGIVGVGTEIQRVDSEESQTVPAPAVNTDTDADESPTYQQGDLFDLLPTSEGIEPDEVTNSQVPDKGATIPAQRPAEVTEVSPMEQRRKIYELQEKQESHTGEMLKATAEAYQEADALYRAEWNNFTQQLGGHPVHKLEIDKYGNVSAEWHFDIHNPKPNLEEAETLEEGYIKVFMRHNGSRDEPLPDELVKAVVWLKNPASMTDKEIKQTPLLGVVPRKIDGDWQYDAPTLASRVGEKLPTYIKRAVTEHYDPGTNDGPYGRPRTHMSEVTDSMVWSNEKYDMQRVTAGGSRAKDVASGLTQELRMIAQLASGDWNDMTAYPDDATIQELLTERYLNPKSEDIKKVRDALGLLANDFLISRGYVVPEIK